MNREYEIVQNKRGKDYTGEKFGRLTVIGLDKNRYYYGDGKSSKKWVCRCDCGNIVSLMPNEFIYGKKKSCGCLKKEMDKLGVNLNQTKHGDCSGGKRSRLFSIWCGIKNRCYNPKSKIYKYYGGRGIKVCDEWLNDYLSFKEWALNNGYSDDGNCRLTIDRVDVDGDYCPDNCRWATMKEQSNNRRNNAFLEYNNVKKTISEWSDITGLGQRTIWRRLNELGWSVEDTLSLPLYTRNKNKLKEKENNGIHA